MYVFRNEEFPDSVLHGTYCMFPQLDVVRTLRHGLSCILADHIGGGTETWNIEMEMIFVGKKSWEYRIF